MAKKTDNQNQEENVSTEVKEKGGRFSNNLVLVLLLAILVIFFVFGGAFFVAYRTGFLANITGNSTQNLPPAQTVREPAYTYEIPEIVVNILEGDRRRFLSVKFYVGFEHVKIAEELDRRMPEIRDAVLQILWEISAADATSNEGKERLRLDILDAMNHILNSGEITGVYFWHVMIQ